tara:strand:- start:15167 stop:15796 length:630 start_codon:yes stop_codon:yes gene_type:complete
MINVRILVDDPDSWMIPFAKEIVKKLNKKGYESLFINSLKNNYKGDVLFLLSCKNIINNFSNFQHNIVIHASDLPKGRGWSPLTWQILEGQNQIPITLFEASSDVDSGDSYFKDKIFLDGNELIDEIRSKLAEKIEIMIFRFLSNKRIKPVSQSGHPTFYGRRTPKDSQLDVNKTIAEQFNLLRVCDNKRYPAYFEYMGNKYILKIFKK